MGRDSLLFPLPSPLLPFFLDRAVRSLTVPVISGLVEPFYIKNRTASLEAWNLYPAESCVIYLFLRSKRKRGGGGGGATESSLEWNETLAEPHAPTRNEHYQPYLFILPESLPTSCIHPARKQTGPNRTHHPQSSSSQKQRQPSSHKRHKRAFKSHRPDLSGSAVSSRRPRSAQC